VELALLSTIISLIIAIPLGIASALVRNSPLDYVIRLLGILTLSVPSFWLATMVLVAGAIYFNWVPRISKTSFIDSPIENLKQFLLPSVLLGAALAGSVMRITRSMMLEVLGEDYIRTARSKGLSLRVVIVRHAIRNALIPVVTVIGLQMAALLGGTVVIESIFGLPGLGSLIVSSLARRDYPVIQGINVVIVLTVVTINLLIDFSYALIDPRVRYG
jgi:peptide/nickel transport system permease protein